MGQKIVDIRLSSFQAGHSAHGISGHGFPLDDRAWEGMKIVLQSLMWQDSKIRTGIYQDGKNSLSDFTGTDKK